MASPKLTPIVYGLVNTEEWKLHSPERAESRYKLKHMGEFFKCIHIGKKVVVPCKQVPVRFAHPCEHWAPPVVMVLPLKDHKSGFDKSPTL